MVKYTSRYNTNIIIIIYYESQDKIIIDKNERLN